MKTFVQRIRVLSFLKAKELLFLILVLVTAAGCRKHFEPKAFKEFQEVNLVANNTEYDASHVDPALINAWGLAFNPTGVAWVSSQEGHVSTIYDRLGNTLRPPVNIPSPGGATGGNPTGIVFNNSDGFLLPNKAKAAFIFVGVDGILSAWNGAAGNNAALIEDNSATSAYTGLTMGKAGDQTFLYAANFRTGKIDVWNSTFGHVSMPFRDPALPSGYAPFNIQNIDGKLYVAYAKVGPDGDEEVGVGNGFVDIFNTDGSFVKRFATRGPLNAPWGMVKAPASFFADIDDGGLQNPAENGSQNHTQTAILVGNFGDGHINAYSTDGTFISQLRSGNKAIVIEGLWALSFAPTAATAINPNWLYFTAGPDDEKHGLFGYIVKE